MINFTIAIRFRIAVIAAVLSLSTLAAEACSCASAGPGGCQVPVADIIVRATAKKDPIRKCSDFHPQYCVFDFVNLRASAENVDLNGCIVGVRRSDVGSIDDDYSPAPSVYAFWNGWLYPSAFSGR